MMANSADIRALTGDRGHEVLSDTPNATWLRSGDLVIGITDTDVTKAADRMREAYNELDESGALRPYELWSIVLVVRVSGDNNSLVRTARGIERDLSRSRKIVVPAAETLPYLFAGIMGQTVDADERPRDPVSSALDDLATGELRVALDVLIRSRRPADEVEHLIRLLGKATNE
jgi:hypothetical protein